MRPLLAAFALLALAACSSEPQPMADFDPHQRYRTTVEKHAAVAVLTPDAQGGIAATDRAVLADLAAEHRRRGAGAVAVVVSRGDDEAAARAFAAAIASALAAEGVSGVQLALADTPGAAAAVEVPVWVAVVPDCGNWPEAISPDFRNQNTANFGCAVTRNIGLMVANPADLERARDATGRSGARALEVLSKYGKGEPTSAKPEDYKPPTLTAIGIAR